MGSARGREAIAMLTRKVLPSSVYSLSPSAPVKSWVIMHVSLKDVMGTMPVLEFFDLFRVIFTSGSATPPYGTFHRTAREAVAVKATKKATE